MSKFFFAATCITINTWLTSAADRQQRLLIALCLAALITWEFGGYSPNFWVPIAESRRISQGL